MTQIPGTPPPPHLTPALQAAGWPDWNKGHAGPSDAVSPGSTLVPAGAIPREGPRSDVSRSGDPGDWAWGRWCAVGSDRRLVPDSSAGATRLRAAAVTCDLCRVWLTCEDRFTWVIHKKGMRVPRAQAWLRGGRGLGASWGVGGPGPQGISGPLTGSRAVSQSHRCYLLLVSFSASGPSLPSQWDSGS